MLTKNDLSQIQTIVKTEIKTELDPVKNDVHSLKNDVDSIKKDIKQVKSKLSRIGKDVHYLSKSMDAELMSHRHRIKRLETHAGLPSIADR